MVMQAVWYHALPPTTVSQWLQDIIALQCSFVRHLSAKQTSSLSRHCEQADVKPRVPPGESSLAHPTAPCEEQPPEVPPRHSAHSAGAPGSCHLPQQPVGSISTDVKVEEAGPLLSQTRKALPPSTPTAGPRAITLPRAPQDSTIVGKAPAAKGSSSDRALML